MSSLNLVDLFQIEFHKKVADIHYFECGINDTHPIFSGHFPEMPIVPGVCLLNAVKRAVNSVIGQNSSFQKIKECKFLSAINPNENTDFSIQFTLSDENEVRGGIFVGDKQCMKLKAIVSF